MIQEETAGYKFSSVERGALIFLIYTHSEVEWRIILLNNAYLSYNLIKKII